MRYPARFESISGACLSPAPDKFQNLCTARTDRRLIVTDDNAKIVDAIGKGRGAIEGTRSSWRIDCVVFPVPQQKAIVVSAGIRVCRRNAVIADKVALEIYPEGFRRSSARKINLCCNPAAQQVSVTDPGLVIKVTDNITSVVDARRRVICRAGDRQRERRKLSGAPDEIVRQPGRIEILADYLPLCIDSRGDRS